MTPARSHAAVLAHLLIAVCCCSNREPSMSTPPPQPILGSFSPLQGGYNQAIAPGPRLVTLLMGGAAWWDGDAAVTATLPPHVPVDGTRWTADGTSLRVGLGTLDLAARAWRPEPALEAFGRPGPAGDSPVRQVAWFADAAHVAILLDQGGAQEVVIASAADGRVRGRRAVENASALIASEDRVLVAARELLLLDLDGNVVATPTPAPDSVVRLNHGDGMFAAVGIAGAVALIRPADGMVLATWDQRVYAAVPIDRGVVVVDAEGTVRVGCFDGPGLREVAQAASGAAGHIVIQRVGDRIVVAGGTTDPVRVASFANPCQRAKP